MTKITIFFTRIARFRTVTLVWIHWWLWNDAQNLKWYWRVALFISRSSVKFQDQVGQKSSNFDSNRAFSDCISSLNSPMAFKWCTKLDVVCKRCPIVFSMSSIKFQGHTGWRIDDLNPIISKITRPVAAIKSLRFVLFQQRLSEIWALINNHTQSVMSDVIKHPWHNLNRWS